MAGRTTEQLATLPAGTPAADLYLQVRDVQRGLDFKQPYEELIPPEFDPYEVSLLIRQAVADGFTTQDEAGNASPFLDDPQPAGSLVGMEFIDPQAEYIYKFRPVAFANGTFNVWCSGLLSR